MFRKRKKLGISFAGGGTKVIMYWGVIKALREAGISIDYTLGISAGSIVACALGLGMDVETASQTIAEYVTLRNFIDLNPFDGLEVVSHQKSEKVLREVFGHKRLEQCKTPTTVVATNIQNQSPRTFDSGDVVGAMMATCSLPPLMMPYQIGEDSYIDGGFTLRYGAKYLKEMGADITLGVRDPGDPTENSVLQHTPGVLNGLYQGLLSSIRQLREYEEMIDPVDFEIKEFSGHIGSVSFRQGTAAEELIDIGYQATLPKIAELQKLLHQ